MEWAFITAAITAVLLTLPVAAATAGCLARCGFPQPDPATRIGCLDGLRGFLAMAVFAHHFTIALRSAAFGRPWEPPPTAFLNELGAGGVALFFMTTGLVFYPRILKGLTGNDWVAVYLGRIFRILPLTIAAFTVVTLIIVTRTGARPDWSYIGTALVWISAYDQPHLLGYADSGRIYAFVVWSLWYEWLFYLLVLPLCAAARQVCGQRVPTIVIPLGLLVLSAALRHFTTLDIAKFLPLFACGMLAFEIAALPMFREVLQKPIAAMAAGIGLIFAMAWFAYPYGWGMLFFAAFFCVVAAGNPLRGALSSTGAVILGEVSFSIYLLHGIIIELTLHGYSIPATFAPLGLIVGMPLLGAAVTLIAAGTYLLIERPAMQLGKRIGQRLRRSPLRRPQEITIAP